MPKKLSKMENFPSGKLSQILSASMMYTPTTGKLVGTITVLTVDGKQHTFTRQIQSDTVRSVFLDECLAEVLSEMRHFAST
jgi:hypothetical protein